MPEEIIFDPVTVLGLTTSPEVDQIFEVIFTIQTELKPVAKTRDNTYTGSKYADLSDIWEAIHPHLTKHSLLVLQTPGREMVTKEALILTKIYHLPSKQWVQWALAMPGGATSQSVGSALTYGSRYALVGFFRMIAVGDDDDGNASTQGQRRNEPRKDNRQQGKQQQGSQQGTQGTRQVAPVLTFACDKPHQDQIEKIIRDAKANKMSDEDLRLCLPQGVPNKYKLTNPQADTFVKEVAQAIYDIQHPKSTEGTNTNE